VRWFNLRHRRTGTLWECRFKSCLVDSDRYLLSVVRYIEFNPVRAGLVGDPAAWRWSSVRVHLGQRVDARVRPHPVFLAFGPDRRSRGEWYAGWLTATISDAELSEIRRHVVKQRALGGERFQAMIERTLNRPAACRNQGRPKKNGSESGPVPDSPWDDKSRMYLFRPSLASATRARRDASHQCRIHVLRPCQHSSFQECPRNRHAQRSR
jgi:putative transposase